ncbi:MAG: hypothetical protein ACOY0T_38845 [Myxococcota bacterium]
MKKLAGIVGLGVLLVNSVALAAGWSQYTTLTSVEVDSVTTGMSGTYLGFSSSVSSNKPACATATLGVLTGSVDSVKTMTSVVTATFLAGKSIRVYWDGTCSGIYGRIAAIEIKN